MSTWQAQDESAGFSFWGGGDPTDDPKIWAVTNDVEEEDLEVVEYEEEEIKKKKSLD